MNVEKLRAWLDTHADDIMLFVDYEPTFEDDAELATTLGYWFGNDAWDDGRYRFAHLGIDGTGSQVAAWFRKDAEPVVVFFGSEGGRGVLAKSLEDWAKVLAYGPAIDEYADFDASLSALDQDGNHLLDEEDADADDYAAAAAALERYRKAVVDRYRSLPTFSELTRDLEALNGEFSDWVESRVG